MPRFGGHSLLGRSPYTLVAASNAPEYIRNQADYLCDGVADDVEIQAAINRTNTNQGTVVLSPGLFTLAAALTMQSGLLAGSGSQGSVDGGTTVIQGGSNLYCLRMVNSAALKVSDIFFDGGGGTTGGGLYLFTQVIGSGSRFTVLENLEISNAARDGLVIDGGFELAVYNCYIRNNGRHGIYISGEDSPEAASQLSFYGVRAENNTTTQCRIDGSVGGGGGVANTLFSDCTFAGTNGAGMALEVGGDVTIISCNFEGNTGDGLSVIGATRVTAFNSTFQVNTNRGVFTEATTTGVYVGNTWQNNTVGQCVIGASTTDQILIANSGTITDNNGRNTTSFVRHRTGSVTISGVNTSSAVAFPGPGDEADANYLVTVSVAGLSAGAANPRFVWVTAKATTGFTINIETAPGGAETCTIDWEVHV